MSYIGSQDETGRNQMFQLSYNNRNNQFEIKVRKDFGFDTEEKYVFGKCFFNNHKNKLIEALMNQNSTPLTYSIIRKKEDITYIVLLNIELRIKVIF